MKLNILKLQIRLQVQYKNFQIKLNQQKKLNSKKSIVKKQCCIIPLNQYDPEFINKTKNKTDNEIDE
ncbi:unnamed protein product [Paramecium sonneborni]|uniref:Uncharacterized protein n=1 Tax=Paramecium sonneborni TaxID=65129 RepID=A0A8S1KV59_9CILI|nr:unnamed protein product [Paramecium sonneborni]